MKRSRRGGSRCSTRPGRWGWCSPARRFRSSTGPRSPRPPAPRTARTSWSTRVRGCRSSFSSRPARRCRSRSLRTGSSPARAFGAASCRCRRGSCSRRNPPSTARRCCRRRCTPGSAWKRPRRSAGNASRAGRRDHRRGPVRRIGAGTRGDGPVRVHRGARRRDREGGARPAVSLSAGPAAARGQRSAACNWG